jgi:phosphoserine phosphatase
MAKIIIDINPTKKLLLFDLDETLVHCFEGEPKKHSAKTRKCFLQTET